MNAVTFESRLGIFKEGEYEDGTRQFQHGRSHRNIHALTPFDYGARYVAVTLFALLL